MTIPFTFDGRAMAARAGQSVAAALTEAGERTVRTTGKGAPRGIFCGMGVCQDCLVTVDGIPNRRACMTAVEPGMTIAPQDPFPTLDPAAAPPATPARVIAPDVLVIGGGAAGLSAAIAARAAGASVVVLDERKVAGGQYFKQAAAAVALDAQQAAGADLLARAVASGAEIIDQVELWGAFDAETSGTGGVLFLGDRLGGALVARPRTVVVATGAYERPEIVPGWNLPGVMTTGAAQTLWRSYRTLPGRRVALAGSGPLNLQVALELARGGAEVAFVAEAAPAPWTKALAALGLALAGPRLTLQGLVLRQGLRGRGVPVVHGARLARIDQDSNALRVTLTDGRTAIVDALCMNAGFEPQNEVLRLLGCAMDYDAGAGNLRCRRDDDCATTIPGVYAAGDCAGLGGAPAAMAEGRIAGRAAAAHAGHGDGYDSFAERRELARHRRFQARLWALHDIAPRLPDVPDDTLICRCEEITAGQVRAGMAEGPGHAGTLKRATRVGMGRCQGRYCGPVAARLVEGSALTDRSFFAPRVPIKPVPIAVIMAAEAVLTADPDAP